MKFNLIPFSGMRETWNFREEPENQHMLGIYVWRVVLVLVLLALICAAWLGIQELNVVAQADNATQVHSTPQAPLDPNALQKQLDSFSARVQTYQTLASSSPPQVADPSK